jgi:hypothetical protein
VAGLRRSSILFEMKPLADRATGQLHAMMKNGENTFAVMLAANQNEK